MAKQGDIIQSMLVGIKKSSDSTHEDMREFKKDATVKIENINSHIINIDKIQAEQKVILEEHIRRTEINEKSLEKLSERIKPIEQHVSMWAGAGKLLAVLSVLAGIAGVVIKLVLK